MSDPVGRLLAAAQLPPPLSPLDRIMLDQRARGDVGYFHALQDNLRELLGGLDNLTILDIGCGRTFPMPLLFNTFHQIRVTGLDIGAFADSHRPTRPDRFYFRRLAGYAGRPLVFAGIDLLRTDIAATAFPDDTFDLVISNVAFEHMPHLPTVARELNRIMKPGGVLRAGVHLFTSISGSHHPLLQVQPLTRFPPGLEPWYHLRGRPGDIDPTLNRWRLGQYRELFETTFECLHWHFAEEAGRVFLTPELHHELAGYTEEELLRPCFTLTARNRKG